MKPNPKIVTAFTHASDEYWLPPQFVVGELIVRHVPALDYDQYLVDGIGVDPATVTPIPNPTPELVFVLNEKAAKWARSDQMLAKRREQKEDSFREESVDEDENHRVRVDQLDASSAFSDEVNRENERLTAERQAEVAELVRKHRRAVR